MATSDPIINLANALQTVRLIAVMHLLNKSHSQPLLLTDSQQNMKNYIDELSPDFRAVALALLSNPQPEAIFPKGSMGRQLCQMAAICH